MCELHFGYFAVVIFSIGCCVNTYSQELIMYAFCTVSYLIVGWLSVWQLLIYLLQELQDLRLYGNQITEISGLER